MNRMILLLLASSLFVSGSLLAADPAPQKLPATVTYSEHIAELVYTNCTSCHRTGQVAPFTLLDYKQTRKHAKTMLIVMQDRFMPPWQPEPGHGEFKNERRLTDYQIALFEKWVETGMSEGDPKKTPALPNFPEGWQIGQPDLIVTMDRPYMVPAQGPDIYQNFVIPLNLKEDKWVTAVEFQATAPKVVHHVLYFLDNSGRAREKASQNTTGQPGFEGMGFRPTGSLGGWAVGATPLRLPKGLAYPLKAGSDLVLQTHFHLSGKVEKEQLTVGLYFADEPPKRTIMPIQLPPAFGLFSKIDIPPGEANFRVSDSFKLPVDVDVVAAGSHAHILGKTMRTTATLPDGTQKKLFYIKDWDFNWQGQYLYKEMFRLPKGTVIQGEVTWDNSAANPRNPNSPPKRMTWGESTDDEMGSVTLIVVPAKEEDADLLKREIGLFAGRRALASKLRGDKIDTKKLGFDPFQMVLERMSQAKEPPKAKPPVPRKSPSKPEVSVKDLNGMEQTPLKVSSGKANVLFFLTTDCPISNSYLPVISTLAEEFSEQGINWYAVQVDVELTREGARHHAKEYQLKLPVVIDAKHELIKATGATVTPEVVILLASGEIAYRGRIDDRYPARGQKRPAPTTQDLRNALEAIRKGESPNPSRTEAVGCLIPDLPN